MVDKKLPKRVPPGLILDPHLEKLTAKHLFLTDYFSVIFIIFPPIHHKSRPQKVYEMNDKTKRYIRITWTGRMQS
ncbi:MAG: hypothetical protein CSA33_03530 [Desulfobulbus propionicus]|nr:MAG: hypothetical protein CSA33_03530 [Desulfobulbus propionicus]